MITSTLQWRKFEDELPKENGVYLLAFKGGGLSVGEFSLKDEIFTSLRFKAKLPVLFWSPLPEYPREV